MNFWDLTDTSKIESISWHTAEVDILTNDWVYITLWWQTKWKPERLYFNKETVNKLLDNKKRKYIDWRFKLTKQQAIDVCKTKWIMVEWIMDMKSDDNIKNDSVSIWDVIYISEDNYNWKLESRILNILKDWNKISKVEIVIPAIPPNRVHNSIRITEDREYLKAKISYNQWISISYSEFCTKILMLESEKYLLITE